MSFDSCVYPCNLHPKQYIWHEHFFHLRVPSYPFTVICNHSSRDNYCLISVTVYIGFAFSWTSYKYNQAVCTLLYLAFFFHSAWCLCRLPIFHVSMFLPLDCWVAFHHMNIQQVVYSLVDWVISRFGVLWIRLLWTFLYKCFGAVVCC